MILSEVISRNDEDICISVRFDNHAGSYFCECGDASELNVRDVQQATAIFISHTHIDHFVNFDFFLRHQLGVERTIVICGPEGITEQVQHRLKSYIWNLIEEGSVAYEVREVIDETTHRRSILKPPLWEVELIENEADGDIYSNEKFKVEYTILDHKTPSVSYLFKESDSVNIDMAESGFRGGPWINELKEAFAAKDESRKIKVWNEEHPASELFHLLKINKGATLGVIMDHAANESNHNKIRSLFKDCDKVYIECFYKAEDQEFAEINYHSYSTQSAKVMREAGVKEPIPVHFSRKYSFEQVEELIEEFETALKASD